jgi:DNA-binding MarR family transcriptional regulator
LTEEEDLFLHSKPVKILVQLNNPSKDNYTSQIAREVDCTYSHTVRIIQRLEERKLVASEKKGRRKYLTLTDPGKEIAETLGELLHQLRQLDQ